MKDMKIDVTRPGAELRAAGVTAADLVEAGFLDRDEMEELRGCYRIRHGAAGDWLAYRKLSAGGLSGREPDCRAPSEDAVLLEIALGHLRERRDVSAENVRLAANMVAAGVTARDLVAGGIALDDLVTGGVVSNAEAAAIEAGWVVEFREDADGGTEPCWEGREVVPGADAADRPGRPAVAGHSVEEVWVAIALARLREAGGGAARDEDGDWNDYRGADAN